MQVLFYDLEDKLALGNAEACGSLDELIERSETVSLHVDERLGNVGLFGEEQFARMPRRSLFLNLSRGFVVDHEALRTHILSGHLAGAAIDVFPEEPKAQGDEFASVLRGLPTSSSRRMSVDPRRRPSTTSGGSSPEAGRLRTVRDDDAERQPARSGLARRLGSPVRAPAPQRPGRPGQRLMLSSASTG
jgi:hypothetical protein